MDELNRLWALLPPTPPVPSTDGEELAADLNSWLAGIISSQRASRDDPALTRLRLDAESTKAPGVPTILDGIRRALADDAAAGRPSMH
ncbi:hypothetical protein [Mobilicoccus pelagius]|uniref:Uncharacterized protein n=1 Tax=Mobilicoccus pelagius NBRC 104925 TaxID=1089455 RepID=H5UUP8_9MICO|nr:hypothetical protein [Mobilicoccus pelagius]GAB49456.1 hypothetical protein MOPEL_130_00630 [Mobilicoccus pelagius NBRC 104925]